MSLIATKKISFEDAIALTQEFIEQIDHISETETEKIVSAFVASENGARGFFVTFLTSDNPVVDRKSPGIINGLKTSPEIVSELLVKNVAMSTAMKLTHQRNQSEEMANQSQRVTNRSLNLIRQLSLGEVEQKITDLKTTISTGEESTKNFSLVGNMIANKKMRSSIYLIEEENYSNTYDRIPITIVT